VQLEACQFRHEPFHDINTWEVYDGVSQVSQMHGNMLGWFSS
jgi:hypothetical protein